MERHIVKVLATSMATHNVKRLIVERPQGYHFSPGQATDVSINKPGLTEELRPFTFTSIDSYPYLEFIIKIYSSHEGVTKALKEVGPGDELILHDVFGAITYRGAGLFIAGGTGITPFISIFRDLASKGAIQGNRLIFVNRTAGDVILKEELEELLGENFINVVESSDNLSVPTRFINKEMIKDNLIDTNQFCYVCGPESFTRIMVEYLTALGVDPNHIVIEQ